MLATTGGPLIVISSPYGRRGELWEVFQRNYGPDGDPRILVAQGESRALNPELSAEFVARQYERDPAAASAEYGAQFRVDVLGFLTAEVVRRCTDTVRERPPERLELRCVHRREWRQFGQFHARHCAHGSRPRGAARWPLHRARLGADLGG